MSMRYAAPQEDGSKRHVSAGATMLDGPPAVIVSPAAPVASPAAGPAPAGALPRVRPGSLADAKACRTRLQQLLAGLDRAGRVLDVLIAQAKANRIFLLLEDRQGNYFDSWEAFCTAAVPWGLGLPPALLDELVAERNDPRILARRVLAAPAQLAPHGLARSAYRTAPPAPSPGPESAGGGAAGDRDPGASPETDADEGGPGAANEGTLGRAPLRAPDTGVLHPGTGTNYLLARLRRDRPDLLAQVADGLLPSAEAAAVVAGIVARKVSVSLTPMSFARAVVKHLTPAERAEVVDLLQHPERIPDPQSRSASWARRRAEETPEARAAREQKAAAYRARANERKRVRRMRAGAPADTEAAG
jgi:hypothetical protein